MIYLIKLHITESPLTTKLQTLNFINIFVVFKCIKQPYKKVSYKTTHSKMVENHKNIPDFLQFFL